MVQYLIRRIIAVVPITILVTVMVFVLLFLSPGDPITMLVPLEELQDLSDEAIRALQHQYGLDRPVPVQYLSWLQWVVQGDLGRSLHSRRRVVEMLAERIPVTVELGLLSMMVSLVVAIPVGIYSARRPNSPGDIVGSSIALFGISAPNFWVAVMLILVFGVKLRWVPPTGFVRWTEDPVQNLQLMILPSVTLGTALMAVVMRMTRSSLLEVLRQDYITTARSKGLRERMVVYRHALKNAMIPVVTIIGLQVGRILGGAMIIEQIFSIPGVGKMTVDAIFARDFPVVQGSVLVTTLAFVVINIVVDLTYAYLDPRIRYG